MDVAFQITQQQQKKNRKISLILKEKTTDAKSE